MAKLGLVAGHGNLPVSFARIAKEKGDTVIAFGLKNVTSRELSNIADKVHWFDWGDYKKAIFRLAAERVEGIVLLGKIKKELFFKDEAALDDDAKRLLEKTGDKKDYAILAEVAKAFRKFGVKVIDPSVYLKEFIPAKGLLAGKEPGKTEWEDIEFAKLVAREIARFDVGQTVAVKDKTVIAVEAVEGTDEAIGRAGKFSGGGFVVVKMARPEQDMRFDIPLAGIETVKMLIRAKGKVLALEAGRTLLMDRKEIAALADQSDISVVAV